MYYTIIFTKTARIYFKIMKRLTTQGEHLEPSGTVLVFDG